MNSEEVLGLINAGRLDDADRIISVMLATAASDSRERAEALYLRGRIAWKKGNQGMAISLYASAAALDPSSPASVALDQAREVMAFFNKDLYNP